MLTSLHKKEVYDGSGLRTCGSEIWSLGATIYAMMSGVPPFRHHEYIWSTSRMNDKEFSTEIRKIVAAMLEPSRRDRPDAFELVSREDDSFKFWRAKSKDAMEYVDIDD